MNRKEVYFQNSLLGKKIPILTLDHKWHLIFSKIDATGQLKKQQEKLNDLLKKQGKAITETKQLKFIKTKLLDEIVLLSGEDEINSGTKKDKKLEENKRLIADCNKKLEKYENQLITLPDEIEQANEKLMIETMNICYQCFEQNATEIKAIDSWIHNIRIELKKNVLRKQDREMSNQEIYSYMHDIFGAEVIEMFDLKHKE